jgi:hypothetical protein
MNLFWCFFRAAKSLMFYFLLSRSLILMWLKNFNLMDFSILCLLKLQESTSQWHQFPLCLCIKRTHIISFQVSEILNIGHIFQWHCLPSNFHLIFTVCLVINILIIYKTKNIVNVSFMLICRRAVFIFGDIDPQSPLFSWLTAFFKVSRISLLKIYNRVSLPYGLLEEFQACGLIQSCMHALLDSGWHSMTLCGVEWHCKVLRCNALKGNVAFLYDYSRTS